MDNGLIAIAAGLAVFTAVGAGVGMGFATGKIAEAISRQPEASGKIMSAMFIGFGLAESTAIYGFVIAIMLLLKVQ